MTARRAPLLAALLAMMTVSAWGQLILNITPTSLPVGGGVFVVGKAITLQQLATQFPNDPTIWSVTLGNLPPGLSLEAVSGAITGTPTQAGAFTFTVSAADVSNNFTGSKQYTVFVSTGAALNLVPLTHPSAAVGSFYFGFLFQASGGVPGYTWALQSGTNSDGLTLDPSIGFLTGIPQVGGAFPIGAVIVDASGALWSSSNNLNVLGISTTSLPAGALGVAYSQTLAAVGNIGSLSWSVPPGTLPPGLNLSLQGQIAGTPTATGTFPFQVTVTDSVTGLSTSSAFSIDIPLNLTITTTSLPNGTVGTTYSPPALTAIGGSGSLSWSLASGTLPPGLNLNAQGQITGTPTQAGTFNFQVRAADPITNLTATQSLSITIAAALTVSTTALPSGAIGLNYSQTLQGTGGTPPYTWRATGLPAGLTLDTNTGILSGVPTAIGASTASVTLTDAAQGTATKQLGLVISALAITPTSLSNGFQNIPYPPVALAVTGNPTITNWAVTAGTLPAGLSLNAVTGVISGKPTVAGSSTFTISATLSVVVAVVPPVQQQFTLVINAPPSVTLTTGGPVLQPTVAVSLGSGTYPLDITGTMTLTFAPASGSAQLYDERFSNGTGTTATFTIPRNTSQASFGGLPSVSVLVGTVAGAVTITTTLQDSAGNPLPSPQATAITVNSTPPVITKVTFGTVTTSGFSISVTGYSTPRNMTSALFHFTSPTNTQLASADVTVPLTSAFTSWYGSAAATPFGSQFTMTVQFSFTGPPGTTVPFTAVTVTLTNSVGTSTVFGPLSP